MSIRFLFPSMAAIALVSGCGKTSSKYVGRYEYLGRDTNMGEEITMAKLDLRPDYTAEAEIRVRGYLQGVGTTVLDKHIVAKGKWKESDSEAELKLDIVSWVDRGKAQTPKDPLELTLDTSIGLNVSGKRIESKERSSYTPLLSSLFGKWEKVVTP